jgi:hypothetical protein
VSRISSFKRGLASPPQAFMKFNVQQYSRKMTTKGANINKISRLLDVLDRHIKEENCRHTPKELLKEYENFE